MIFNCGLQKFTLLDYPGYTACIIFLKGCNMNCSYCHNYNLAQGEEDNLMPVADLYDFLKRRVGKLDGVVITGGEPTMHGDLPWFIQSIKSLGFKVKLDTNGTNPQMLEYLLNQHLVDYVAMDIKCSLDSYNKITRVHTNIYAVSKSIELIKQHARNYEFRTTVIPEMFDDQTLRDIGLKICGAEHYYLQSFVPSKEVPVKSFTQPSDDLMLRYKNIVSKYVKHAAIR